MALLKILHYPDPRLRTIAKPVEHFDADLAKLVADMAETMYDAVGIGLAATQVNVHKQVIVMDLSENRSDLKVFINPVIQKASDQHVAHQEGCLSVPGVFDEVQRPDLIHVKAQKKRRCTLHRSLLIALLCSLLIALIAFIAIVCCCCM